MKCTLRLPTSEPYAYVEIEFDKQLSPHEVTTEYNKYMMAIKGEAGLPEREFNAILDEYNKTHNVRNGQEQYVKMNAQQQTIIQAIKRSFARIDYEAKADLRNNNKTLKHV